MSLVRDWKRLLAFLVTGTVGILVLLDAAFGLSGTEGEIIPVLRDVALVLVNWAAILTAMALFIGILSVAGTHGRRVVKREADWGYSIVLVTAMVLVIVVGLFGGDITRQQILAEQPFRIVFTTIYTPLASSLLALLAFFSLSAALRALTQRRVEAWVIVGVALVVLLTQIGPVASVPFVGSSLQWFNDVVVLAGARGLVIGAALGTLVASIRVLLGFDLPFLDR